VPADFRAVLETFENQYPAAIIRSRLFALSSPRSVPKRASRILGLSRSPMCPTPAASN